MADGRWVKLADLDAEADAGRITREQKMTAAIVAIEDWAIVEALRIIHGTEAGLARYYELRGHVRPNAEGEPCVWVPE